MVDYDKYDRCHEALQEACMPRSSLPVLSHLHDVETTNASPHAFLTSGPQHETGVSRM